MGDGELMHDIAAMLGRDVAIPPQLTLEPCTAGGNNRVFRVRAGDVDLVAKAYYHHPSDTRERLRAEYAFLTFCATLGLDCVPRPVSCDRARHLGLYEYISGRKLAADEIGETEIAAAARFIVALNDPARRKGAGLPDASEACFSLAAHAGMLEQRLARLDGIDAATEADRDARGLVAELRERWRTLHPRIAHECAALGFAADAPLPAEDRCISPSDFGFHNALMRRDGSLVFIDFEYAGWDDPAKLANDFFCQPAVPVDARFYDGFVRETVRFAADPARMAARSLAMRAIFQVKWCCIMLNDFIPAASLRRRYADPTLDVRERKARQLSSVRARLPRIGN
jgi:hypothetical protein